MSTKLRNRRVAEDKLGTFLEEALISEDLIHQVMDAPVSAAFPWVACAHLLHATVSLWFVWCTVHPSSLLAGASSTVTRAGCHLLPPGLPRLIRLTIISQ